MSVVFARKVDAGALPKTSMRVVGYFAAEQNELKFHPLDPCQSPIINCTGKAQKESQVLLRCLQAQNRGKTIPYVYPGQWTRVEGSEGKVTLLFVASTTQFLPRQ